VGSIRVSTTNHIVAAQFTSVLGRQFRTIGFCAQRAGEASEVFFLAQFRKQMEGLSANFFYLGSPSKDPGGSLAHLNLSLACIAVVVLVSATALFWTN
jgi:hypothetical protein